MRDPDLLIYFREEGGGLVMGGYERHPRAVVAATTARRSTPSRADFNGRLLEEDWDRFEEIVVNARKRVPAMDDVTITRLINGPEAFTPDGEFCLGETAVRGFFVAAGFCAHGLAGAGGIGKVMAEWIVEGEPSLDLWRDGHPALRRALPLARATRSTRTREVYETYYDIKYPDHERQAGRPLRVSPGLRLARARTAPRSARSPAGSGSTGTRPTRRPATRRCARAAGPGSTGRRRSAPSTRACREAAALFDETSFAKLEVCGPGRAPSCSSACATTASRARSGKITYTQMLNRRGGIECDFTVTRLAEDRFWIVTGTAFGRHDLAWIRSHCRPTDGDVRVEDVTSRWACLGLWGPRARDVLARLHARPTSTSRT